MADLDEDWKKFLDSTLEDDEEVETDEEDETEETDADEEVDQDDPNEEEDADEDDEEEAEADPKKSKKTDKKKSVAYKPRLKQFIDDKGNLKAQELETAYIESSKNGVKLNTDLKEATEKLTKVSTDYNAILGAIKAKPDIAKAIFGEEGAKTLAASNIPDNKKQEVLDPEIAHLKASRERKSQAEYDEFIKNHPEAATDPDRAEKIGRFMKIFGNEQREANAGEIPTMADALKGAYRYYGWDLKDKKKEDLAAAVKKNAATRSAPRGHRKATKKEASMSERFFADKLGVKLKSK